MTRLLHSYICFHDVQRCILICRSSAGHQEASQSRPSNPFQNMVYLCQFPYGLLLHCVDKLLNPYFKRNTKIQNLTYSYMFHYMNASTFCVFHDFMQERKDAI